MTMFSMKPKFNLAEFLAEPAKPNSSRKRSTMNPASPQKAPKEPKAEESGAPASLETKAP